MIDVDSDIQLSEKSKPLAILIKSSETVFSRRRLCSMDLDIFFFRSATIAPSYDPFVLASATDVDVSK